MLQSRFAAALAATLLSVHGLVGAVTVPTAPGFVLFDLNPGGVDHAMSGVGAPANPNPVVGGICGTAGGGRSFFACAFIDNVNLPANLWAWETEIVNNAPAAQNYKLGFYYPGGLRTMNLNLNPGERFEISMAVEDALAGEVGNRRIWYSYRNLPGRPIGVDASVVESAIAGGVNGNFVARVLPAPGAGPVPVGNFALAAIAADQLDFSLSDPALEALAISVVPEPATVAMWLAGLGALARAASRRRQPS